MAGITRMSFFMVIVALVIISVSPEGKFVEAVHHIVGGDQGWDRTSDVDSWSSGRIYRVGDQIWFMYSAAEGSVAELKSKNEFDSCDFRNPIKMYTDGIDKVVLNGEGNRYFISSSSEKCKNGLKLHVNVEPKPEIENHQISIFTKPEIVVATGPTPSGSTQLPGVASLMWVIGLALVSIMGL